MRSYSSWASLKYREALLQDILSISLFVIATALAGKIKVEIGDVPITFQSLVVLLSGLTLGPIKGAYSQITYLLLGLGGLPLFARGGGIFYVFSPTFGYLLGFILASFISGIAGQIYRRRNSLLILCSGLLLANFSIYIPGLLWLETLTHFDGIKLLRVGFFPFLVGDFLKILMLVGGLNGWFLPNGGSSHRN